MRQPVALQIILICLIIIVMLWCPLPFHVWVDFERLKVSSILCRNYSKPSVVLSQREV